MCKVERIALLQIIAGKYNNLYNGLGEIGLLQARFSFPLNVSAPGAFALSQHHIVTTVEKR